jgi:amino acid adenylation domain-containing protein/non-ribosomal peptide synthase protein (TIGR01720 family)
VSHVVPENAIAKLDLSLNIYETLNISENSSGLTGVFRYNTDLFTPATISRMVGHFLTLLSSIVNNPDQKLSHLPLLTAAEQHQLLVEWNDTKTVYSQDKFFHQIFSEQVERVPDAIAVVFQDQQLTYRELNCRANQLAHYLQGQGVGSEVLVGICVERSLEMIVGILGILKAGGAYVPLDPTYPQERVAFMLSDSQVPILLTTQKLLTQLPKHQAQVICLDTDWARISTESEQTPESNVQIQNLAYLIYTSGSTGKPKGVLVTHEGLGNLTEDKIRTCRVQSDSRILQFFSLSFDASIPEIVMALGSGATLCLATSESLLPGSGLMQLLREQAITHITIIPSALAALPQEELPALQMVLVGGEACSPELIERWSKGRLFINAYGPTETTVNASMVECGNNGQKFPTVRPAANKQLYILDQNLQLVPIGVPGELHISGVGLARGYLNRPDKTAEVFITNPFSNEPKSRLYKTGDLACYLSDGNIKLLGRLDHQVKIRGFRIELGEIEALLSQHPEVRDCVVIAREDNPGEKRLVAYIVPTTESVPTTSDLRHFLEEQLPEYMIPALFVFLEALPLNPSGKVDRQALPAPGTTRPELEDVFVAPRTPTEKALADIWAELLNLEQIGIHDNFFDLGGDSILSTQFIARANQVNLEFTTKQLFEHQTIAELAAVVGTVLVVQAEQGVVTGSVPLTPIQHWFFEHNWSEPHHFNQSILLEGPPNLKPKLLQQVIQQLLLHHDALRLQFVPSASGWQQIHASPEEIVSLCLRDLSEFSASEQKLAIEATAAELQTSFNLQAGPLMRVVYFDLGANKSSRLLLVIHHLVIDAVSWRILLEDFQTMYKQLSQGEAINLLPKTTSFQQWANLLNEWALSEEKKEEMDYWLAALPKQVSFVPVDFPDGDNTVASERSISFSLSETETQALLQEVPKAYQTQINDVLLTALVQAFEQWTGNKSLLVNLEGHGREEIFDNVNLSRTVGWFTTVFPVFVNLGDASETGDALKLVKEQLRSIPNRGISYGVLRYLTAERAKPLQLQAQPQAEISFNYLGQFDQVFSESSLFTLAKESSGAVNSPRGSRFHLLEINSMVMDGQLQVNWNYSEGIHHRATVESLAQGFMERLRSLITHCQFMRKNYTAASLAESNVSQQTRSKPSSPLIALQPRGSGRPIFFAHALGGTVITYYQLARYLGSDQPFYALQSPGIDGEKEPLTRIEDMASEYIKAIRSVQPNGPYILGGWSMGAFITFEMAQQLQNQGQEVALLAIVSQQKTLTNKYSDDDDDAKMFAQLFHDLAGSFGKESSISDEYLRQFQPDEQKKYVFEQMKTIAILPVDLEFWQFCNYMLVIKSNIKAMLSYAPQVCQKDMRMILFRTSDIYSDGLDEPTLGWNQLSSEKVEIHDIPGEHLTLLNEPHVQILAEHLKQCLN